MQRKEFKDKAESVLFYENRYRMGYMGFWSDFEKQRLYDLVSELNLPSSGKLLDFGCGRGIFTRILASALPNWQIFGCDISATAIDTARENNPKGKFYVIGDPELNQHRFDFIHSHHVLEHAFDDQLAANDMIELAAPLCKMLHSLPCNHPGSLEFEISSRVKNGLDPMTGKFFFEDVAHLRRLKVDEIEKLFQSAGLKLTGENYANQHFGALKWIAESNFGLVWKISSVSKAISFSAAIKQIGFRIHILFLWFCFFSARAFEQQDKGSFYHLKKLFQYISFCFTFWVAIPVRNSLVKKAIAEWQTRRKEENGSEMFLIFTR